MLTFMCTAEFIAEPACHRVCRTIEKYQKK